MSSDPGSPEPAPARYEYQLPTVTNVQVRRARAEPSVRRNFESALPSADEVIEIILETSEPIPIRALGPVLYVGETPVTEVTPIDETHYRFTSFEPGQLREGSELSIGWSGQAAERRALGARYESERPEALST
jgi:hypothetical protein